LPPRDAVLVEVARRCTAVLGPEHLFARLGGEEFAVLVTGTAAPEVIAERLREEIFRLALDDTGLPLGVTVSIGLAGSASAATGIEAMLADADRHLYAAKDAGRNRVASARAA